VTITIIILTAGVTVFILAIRAAIKHRNKGESKLSVYEHPSTFKKPDIEMVNNVSQKQYDSTKTIDTSSIQIKDDKRSTSE
jgi:hypothetical protein